MQGQVNEVGACTRTNMIRRVEQRYRSEVQKTRHEIRQTTVALYRKCYGSVGEIACQSQLIRVIDSSQLKVKPLGDVNFPVRRELHACAVIRARPHQSS